MEQKQSHRHRNTQGNVGHAKGRDRKRETQPEHKPAIPNYGGGTYDFNTGDATAPNKGKGKIQGRQLHVLVRTAMRWKDRSKGLKGIEVPTGSIGYKLNVSSVFQDDDKHAKHAG